jgi:hypothetical protein
MPDRHWIEAVRRLRAAREPGVLVTLATVSGHAPRDAGAKLVVGGQVLIDTLAAPQTAFADHTAIGRWAARLTKPAENVGVDGAVAEVLAVGACLLDRLQEIDNS